MVGEMCVHKKRSETTKASEFIKKPKISIINLNSIIIQLIFSHCFAHPRSMASINPMHLLS